MCKPATATNMVHARVTSTIASRHSSLLADMPCAMVQTAQEEGMEAAHMLCMTAAPAAREEALALWAWLRAQWGLGLVEAWAMTGNAEVSANSQPILEAQLTANSHVMP